MKLLRKYLAMLRRGRNRDIQGLFGQALESAGIKTEGRPAMHGARRPGGVNTKF